MDTSVADVLDKLQLARSEIELRATGQVRAVVDNLWGCGR